MSSMFESRPKKYIKTRRKICLRQLRALIDFKFISGCVAGYYFSDTESGSCLPCKAGNYSAGGFGDSCIECPEGKTVTAGQGGAESDCIWPGKINHIYFIFS